MKQVIYKTIKELVNNQDIQIIDGDRGKNYPKKEEFKSIGFCVFLNASNIKDDTFVFENIDFISEEKDNLLRKGKLSRNDIVITTRGTVGLVAYYGDNIPYDNMRINSGMIIIRVNSNVINPNYFYQLLKSKSLKKQYQLFASGCAQPQLPIQDFRLISIPVFTKTHQDKIAKILSNYDDLIENNNKRIKILEEMAQKIYKEWFVDFKFPNHEAATFKDSELGKIPSDWEISTLENILSGIESGSRPKGGINPNDKEIPSIGAENILGLGKYDYNKEKYVSNDFYEKMKKGKVKDLDVLLYKDGAQLGRKSIFGENFPHSKCCINEHVFILRTNPKCSPYYLYFTLDTIENTERIKQLNTNAAQPGINQEQVKGLTIILPLKKYIEKFDNVVKPIVSQIFKLCIKNQTFKQTRELLLPRLISGEIDVENMEIK